MTLLEFQCFSAKVPTPVAEFKFHPTRRWKFDFCWPAERVALEQEGGVWLKGGGRHTRGKGYLADLEKYNSAACMGYLVIRATPQQVQDGSAFVWVKRALEERQK